jgi:peroxiredoxin
MPTERVPGVLEGGTVSVGVPAPDFELPALIGGVRKTFRLNEYRGRSVVLAFYPFNWQEASIRQMKDYQAQRLRLLASNAEAVAINVESILNTTAWERHNGPFDFPLCSDFWPHGAVCGRYGVLRESGSGAGSSERAIVVVSPAGRVVLRKIYEADEIPPLDEVFPVLESA